MVVVLNRTETALARRRPLEVRGMMVVIFYSIEKGSKGKDCKKNILKKTKKIVSASSLNINLSEDVGKNWHLRFGCI